MFVKGSVVRDVIIDPLASEMERSRFLLDFSYRSSSFLGLLQIDDPLNEGSPLLSRISVQVCATVLCFVL